MVKSPVTNEEDEILQEEHDYKLRQKHS